MEKLLRNQQKLSHSVIQQKSDSVREELVQSWEEP